MSLSERINQFLLRVYATDNTDSAPVKLEQAVALLRELSPEHMIAHEMVRALVAKGVAEVMASMKPAETPCEPNCWMLQAGGHMCLSHCGDTSCSVPVLDLNGQPPIKTEARTPEFTVTNKRGDVVSFYSNLPEAKL